jgi:hypothetical protein
MSAEKVHVLSSSKPVVQYLCWESNRKSLDFRSHSLEWITWITLISYSLLAPVTCTRQNEEWKSCPSACYSDYCFDVPLRSQPCNISPGPCFPQCQCVEGFARDYSGLCIPIDECRKYTWSESANTYIHTTHDLSPEWVGEASQIFLRDAHVLPKLFSNE